MIFRLKYVWTSNMISPDDAMLAKQSLVWIQTYLHQSAIRKPRFISQNYPIIINEFIVLIHSFHCWNYASYFKMSSTFSEVPKRSAAVSYRSPEVRPCLAPHSTPPRPLQLHPAAQSLPETRRCSRGRCYGWTWEERQGNQPQDRLYEKKRLKMDHHLEIRVKKKMNKSDENERWPSKQSFLNWSRFGHSTKVETC